MLGRPEVSGAERGIRTKVVHAPPAKVDITEQYGESKGMRRDLAFAAAGFGLSYLILTIGFSVFIGQGNGSANPPIILGLVGNVVLLVTPGILLYASMQPSSPRFMIYGAGLTLARVSQVTGSILLYQNVDSSVEISFVVAATLIDLLASVYTLASAHMCRTASDFMGRFSTHLRYESVAFGVSCVTKQIVIIVNDSLNDDPVWVVALLSVSYMLSLVANVFVFHACGHA